MKTQRKRLLLLLEKILSVCVFVRAYTQHTLRLQRHLHSHNLKLTWNFLSYNRLQLSNAHTQKTQHHLPKYQVSHDHDLINQLNNHYNKNRHIPVSYLLFYSLTHTLCVLVSFTPFFPLLVVVFLFSLSFSFLFFISKKHFTFRLRLRHLRRRRRCRCRCRSLERQQKQ